MLRLKELRARSGETQQAVSDATGIDRSLYVKYEDGSRTPPLKNLIILANHFNVTLDYLSLRTDDPSAPHELYKDIEPPTLGSITDIAAHSDEPMTREDVEALVKNELINIKKELQSIKKDLSKKG